MAKEKDFFGAKKGSVLAGAGGLVASVIGFLWAQSHAPGNISTALSGGWVLKGAILQYNGRSRCWGNPPHREPCSGAHLATERLSMNAMEDAAALSGEPFG